MTMKMHMIYLALTLSISTVLTGENITINTPFPETDREQRQVTMSEGNLHYDRPFHLVYTVPESGFNNFLQNPKDIQALLYRNQMDPPEIIDLNKDLVTWKATFTVSDTSVKMILIAFQAMDSLGLRHQNLIDDNNGQYWDLLIYDMNNKPVQGAHQIRALSYTGMGGKRNKNMRRAYDEIKNELTLYPDNLSARSLMYSILLSASNYGEETRSRIEREVDSLLRQKPDDETIMNFAVSGYRMIGETTKAQRIEAKLIKRNPRSNQAAMKALDEITKIENVEDRAQRLDIFLEEYSDSRMVEFALTNLATTCIELDDSTKMIVVGDELMEKATSPSAASGLAGIAGVLSEKQFRLDRAAAYANKAIALIQSANPSTKPSEMSPREWEQQNRNTKARYQDILGWIYFHQGKMNQSISELKEAVQSTSQPGVYYHLALALEKTGALDDALLNHARAVAFGGEIGDMAYQTFYDLWLQAEKQEEGMEPFLDEQAEWIRRNYERRVLSQRSVRPAPNFELEDLDGGWVSLSDQKDSIILLCFWASWSESSWEMLRVIHELSRIYGEDVLLLTISTDSDYYTVKDYVSDRRIFLPVLLNDGTDEDYGLQGVPTLFIIDKKGQIHFEHKGYRPGLQEILAVELDDLLQNGER